MGTARPHAQQIDALELLAMQHAEVDQLLAELETDDLARERKRLLFQELANKVAAHAAMEEQLFYPMVRAKQTEEILLESTEEHLAIKRVLADMMETDLEDPRFDAKLSVLKEALDHHAHEEEEQILFPELRRLMSEEQLQVLGAELLSLYEDLLTQEPRTQVPKQIRKPAEL